MKKTLQKMILAVSLLGVAVYSYADEVSVKKTLLSKYKALSENTPVKKTEINGLYLINLQGKAAYTNETVDFLLVGGSVINTANLEDITAKNQSEFLKDFFSTLPLESAFKRVYGKGERVLVTFEDPDCPFCQKQAKIFEDNAAQINATVYTFLFPITKLHPDGLRKANYIACSENPNETLKKWMVTQTGLPLAKDANGNVIKGANGKTVTLDSKAKTTCDATKKVTVGSELARSLSYTSTPRFIFANGWGAKGWLEFTQLEEGFAMVALEKTTGKKAPPPKK